MALLYQGDVIEVLGNSPLLVDVVVTSPPYNLGKDYRVSKDKKPYADYLQWVAGWAAGLWGVTHDESHVFINVGGSPTQPTIPFDVLSVFLRMGWVLQNEIVWNKSISIGDESYGHFKPINSPRFVSQTHEYVWHFTKLGDLPVDRLAAGVPYKYKSNIKRWAGVKSDRRCQGNSWFIPYETRQESREEKLHPATFPRELPRRCLQLAGVKPGMRVLDPFCGTGTTLVVAQEMGAECFGIDLCRDYLEVTAKRLGEDPSSILTGEA